MMTPNNEPTEFYLDVTTNSGTEVGARTFRFLHRDPGAEVVLESVTLALSTNESMSTWEEIKALWAILSGKRAYVTADVSLLFDRGTAIKVNDELIEALYYDESGKYHNGSAPSLPTEGNEQPSTTD
jgi:hypothetical protein